MPTHSFPCLSSGYVPFCCLFHADPMLFPQCSKHQSSMLKASILESNNNIPRTGLVHSLACNWHSFSCSRGCLSRTQPEALGLCCLWTSRLLHIRALLGPAHAYTFSRLLMVPHTTTSVLLMDPCLLHTRALLGPTYTYTFSRLLMVPHTTRSVLLMDPRLLYVQARTGPETPCPGSLCPLLCYSASCSHPAPYKPNRCLCVL